MYQIVSCTKSPTHPLPLVAIITSAASPLSSQLCRTLLRHNALVLGIDSLPVTESSHRLFSALGTHFQTLQLDLEDPDAITRIVAHSENRFWKAGFDVLVTFGEGDGSVKLRREVSEIMRKSGGGVLLNVLDEGSVGQSEDVVALASERASTGVRANVVLVDGFAAGGEGWEMLEAPVGAVKEVKECVERFRGLTEEDGDTERGERGVADLLLYLSAEELGGEINRAVVTADGRWKKL